MENYRDTNWWKYLDVSMQDLVMQSLELLRREKENSARGVKFNDYSFVIFPMAKAYEGFLKKVFFDLRFITRQQYFGDHFRIGRALSPMLPKRYRQGWVYGRLVGYCQGEELPLFMWDIWKKARNRTFHFFPQHRELVSLSDAEKLVMEILEVMDKTLLGCRVI